MSRGALPLTLPVQLFPVPILGVLFLAVPAQGQGSAGSVGARSDSASAAAAARAVPRQGTVTIDGRLDETAWEAAPVIDDFVQARPEEGAEPARHTDVRVLYDGGALYVGARMYDDPNAVADQLVRRDASGAFDYFRVEVDPNGDDLTGYLFQVGASGAERDAFLYDDTRVDDAFDAVWASTVDRDSLGWTAEMRVPLSQIDFETSDTTQAWGINFVRRRLASTSTAMFALRSRTRSGRVSQFGRLTGLQFESGGGALEVSPYASARARRAPAAPGNPFFDGSSLTPRVGLDASWSPRSNVTIDAAINPDFGQVEVDPAVVDLSAFESFFPEKRPFFTQDGRLFDFPLSGARRTLFHSRRIGQEPVARPPPGADFVDVPGATTILGAAKATGRTSEGLSFGALGAATAEETGRAHFDDSDGEQVIPSSRTRTFVAQPASQYGVVRLQQDLRGGGSNVGVIAAGVHRGLPADGRLDDLADTEIAGGIDFQHQWGGERGRRNRLWGYFTGSWIHGTPQAITAVQTDPNHYFQRPDAEYLSVDSTATSLVGREWRLQLERQSGRHWTWQAWVNEVSPAYVIDGVGFAGRTLPRIDVGGQVRYQDVSPGPLFRNWSVLLNTFHNFRHSVAGDPLSPDRWADARESGSFRLSSSFTLHNNWSVSVGTGWEPAAFTERETRGGPLVRTPESVSAGASVRTDPRSAVSLVTFGDWTNRRGAGDSYFVDTRLALRPSANWEVQLGPRYRYDDDRAQYATTTGAVPYEPTSGDRYLFADVIREELSISTRVDAAFTPNLSLQVFAQPLLSAGDFVRYKELVRPRSFDFREFSEGEAEPASSDGDTTVRCAGGTTCVDEGGIRYVDLDGDGRPDESFGDRDFSFRSLRGNAVLRWEYAPGSELFLVWQQSRQSGSNLGRFRLDEDLGSLLESRPENVFMVKLRHHHSL